MNRDRFRQYLSVHGWLGIVSSIILFVGFYAGALTLYKDAIDAWFAPQNQALPAVSAQQLDHLIDQVLQAHPSAAKQLIINIHQAEQSPLIWYEQGRASGLSLEAIQRHASLDQQGKLITQLQRPSALADLIDHLHRSGGIPGMSGYKPTGLYVMGVAAFVLFIVVVTGLLLVLPVWTKKLFSLRADSPPRKALLDLHNLLGLTSLPFYLVISVTVVVFAFDSQFYRWVDDYVYGDVSMFQSPSAATQSAPELASITTLITLAEEQAPHTQVHNIVLSGLGSPYAMAQIALFDPTGINRGPVTDYLFVDPYDLTLVANSAGQGPEDGWLRAVSGFYALHFGSFAGSYGRVIYFCLALAGAVLCLSGNLLWCQKRLSRTTRTQRNGAAFLYRSTIGICFGSILGVTMSMAVGKVAGTLVAFDDSLFIFGYYAVLCLALIWAWFSRGELLRMALSACAMTTLLIPIASLTVWIVSGDFGAAPQWQARWVDIGAILLALMFNLIKPVQRVTAKH